MKPNTQEDSDDDFRPESDFDIAKAECGRYGHRLKAYNSNRPLVVPHLVRSFPDSAWGNAALRSVVEFAKLPDGLTRRAGGRNAKRRSV